VGDSISAQLSVLPEGIVTVAGASQGSDVDANKIHTEYLPSPAPHWDSPLTVTYLSRDTTLAIELLSESERAVVGSHRLSMSSLLPLAQYELDLPVQRPRDRDRKSSTPLPTRVLMTVVMQEWYELFETNRRLGKLDIAIQGVEGCHASEVAFVSFVVKDLARYQRRLALADDGRLWRWDAAAWDTDRGNGAASTAVGGGALYPCLRSTNFVAQADYAHIASQLPTVHLYPYSSVVEGKPGFEQARLVVELYKRRVDLDNTTDLTASGATAPCRWQFLGFATAPIAGLTSGTTKDLPATNKTQLTNGTPPISLEVTPAQGQAKGMMLSVAVTKWTNTELRKGRPVSAVRVCGCVGMCM
jgi:hypothetical protein